MSMDEKKPEGEEMVSLNADDLDVEELDEKRLEEAAGGTEDWCWDMSCGQYSAEASAI
ncbi:MAG TPA: hypothetical protein VFX98_17500 [Longimicrobiaceae bacterium]|nr:hypothetical protein [Longimicrobiaceae bacterium]